MLNKDILTLFSGLQTIAANTEMQLPAKVAFAIARNIKVLTPIVEDIETARIHIGETYGILTEQGYNVPSVSQEVANKELLALANTEVEVPIVKIKISDIEDLNISVSIAEALIFMIEEEV
mgnify:FL=1